MKYHIITYGCQMNKSDSERITASLESAGYQPASKEDEANLIVINMCSVRQSAVDRAISKLKIQNEKHKTRRKKTKIILTGCILDKNKQELNKFCDGMFAMEKLPALPKLLKKWWGKAQSDKRQKTKHYLEITPKYQSPISAYIPIMTGCNNFCSYCVVPHTRGEEISRSNQNIICEIKKSILNGTKEIWLLGQNVNSYKCKIQNANFKMRKEINFAKLLEIINDIEGNFWIRFTSSHPKDLNEELIEVIAKCEKVTPYLNLPIQSGDDYILKKMNRPYTIKQYKLLVKKLKIAFKKHRNGLEKDLAISTDVIVGFPGETKKQFENTKKTFGEIGFAAAYVSRYSPRPQTAAFQLKNDVPNDEKKKREKELFKILEKSALSFNKKFLNETANVLILEKRKEFYIGKTRHHQTIRIKSDKNIFGNFVKAKITEIMPYGLTGKLME